MRHLATACLVSFFLFASSGCANPYRMQLAQAEQEKVAMRQQYEQLQARTTTLDQENQEVNQLLAQSRQQVQIFQEQADALRQQLASATDQVERLKSDTSVSKQKVENLVASMRSRGGAIISPNNSLSSDLPQIEVAGVQVRRDGDVIRFELSCDQLFETGGVRLRPGSDVLLKRLGDELLRNYPGHKIAVEGHTDSDPVRLSQYPSNHHLSLAQATTVYEFLANNTQLQARQLLVVGHGGNHPLYSNASPAGKARNRRVEIVVYPDRIQ